MDIFEFNIDIKYEQNDKYLSLESSYCLGRKNWDQGGMQSDFSIICNILVLK